MASGWNGKKKKINRHSILLISRKRVHSYLSIGDNHCNRCANKTLLIPPSYLLNSHSTCPPPLPPLLDAALYIDISIKIVCTPRYAIFISLVKFISMCLEMHFFLPIIVQKLSLFLFIQILSSFFFFFFLNDHRIMIMFSSLIS